MLMLPPYFAKHWAKPFSNWIEELNQILCEIDIGESAFMLNQFGSRNYKINILTISEPVQSGFAEFVQFFRGKIALIKIQRL